MGKRSTAALTLVALASDQGFRVRRTKKGFMVYAKEVSLGCVTLHLTDSDKRAIDNMRADLRKIGVRL